MEQRSILPPSLLTNGHGQQADATLVRELPEISAGAADSKPGALGWKVWLPIILVTVAAAGCIAYFGPGIEKGDWSGILALIVVAVLFERFGIRVYQDTTVSAGVVAMLAVDILYGPPGAVIVGPAVALAADTFTNAPWFKRLSNAGTYTLFNVVSAAFFGALIDVGAGVDGWWVPAGLATAVVCYGANALLVFVPAGFAVHQHPWYAWKEDGRWLFPYYVVFGLLGLALATAYLALGVAGILAFVAPPLMMRFALHQYVSRTEQTVLELKQKNVELETANHNITRMTRQLRETYDGTLEALVLALDARDRETKGHSLRVTAYTMAIARQLGIEEGSREWTDIQRGALLHDVGKIGVSDYILHKPGPLTPEEWDDMKRHSAIGHEMLRDISFLSGAAAIVLAHHERFDGKGYPRGLMGNEVPLGARIFSVADAFDAMTSDRPYRRALPPELARDEIVRHSGTQFDPRVVQAFLLVFEELARQVEAEHLVEHSRAA